jgi:hypothetical protein
LRATLPPAGVRKSIGETATTRRANGGAADPDVADLSEVTTLKGGQETMAKKAAKGAKKKTAKKK